MVGVLDSPPLTTPRHPVPESMKTWELELGGTLNPAMNCRGPEKQETGSPEINIEAKTQVLTKDPGAACFLTVGFGMTQSRPLRAAY